LNPAIKESKGREQISQRQKADPAGFWGLRPIPPIAEPLQKPATYGSQMFKEGLPVGRGCPSLPKSLGQVTRKPSVHSVKRVEALAPGQSKCQDSFPSLSSAFKSL
jgi:hypothetical protein